MYVGLQLGYVITGIGLGVAEVSVLWEKLVLYIWQTETRPPWVFSPNSTLLRLGKSSLRIQNSEIGV